MIGTVRMNRKLYSMLCENYNKTKSEEHYGLLKMFLEDCDPIYLERAINKIIKQDKFFPSAARIIEVYDEVDGSVLTEEEKLKKWSKEGIVPECTTKEPTEEEIYDEELKELQEEWDLLFK